MKVRQEVRQALEREAFRKGSTATCEELARQALAGINDALCEWITDKGALMWWRRWAREVRELEEHNDVE